MNDEEVQAVALAVRDGRLAPCLPGVDLLLVGPSGDPADAEILSTLGWSFDSWPRRLHERDVGTLLCAGIHHFMAGMMHGFGIRVVPGLAGEASEVLRLYRSGAPLAPSFPGRGRGRGGGRRMRRGRKGNVPWGRRFGNLMWSEQEERWNDEDRRNVDG